MTREITHNISQLLFHDVLHELIITVVIATKIVTFPGFYSYVPLE